MYRACAAIEAALMRVMLCAAVVLLTGCAATVPGMAAYNEGLVHQERGERAQAEQQYKIALEQQPELAEAHLNLGLMYLDDGWLDGAEDQTRQAIQTFERTKRTYVQGATYVQSLSLAYNNLGIVQMNRAVGLLGQGQLTQFNASWSDGMSNLRKAVDLDPTDSKAQANVARYQALGR